MQITSRDAQRQKYILAHTSGCRWFCTVTHHFCESSASASVTDTFLWTTNASLTLICPVVKSQECGSCSSAIVTPLKWWITRRSNSENQALVFNNRAVTRHAVVKAVLVERALGAWMSRRHTPQVQLRVAAAASVPWLCVTRGSLVTRFRFWCLLCFVRH